MPNHEARFALLKELIKMKPIKPNEVQDEKNAKIPDAVIACVNEMIVENWHEHKARIGQDALLKRVLSRDADITKEEIFANHWFDFEPLFRKVGWDVVYDKPAYNESYEASFTFSKSKIK